MKTFRRATLRVLVVILGFALPSATAQAAGKVLTAPGTATYWFQGATEVWMTYQATGASVRVRQNQKYFTYNLTLNGSGKVRIAWGLPASLQRLAVEVAAGSLIIKQIQPRNPNGPVKLLPPSTRPVLLLYGDSIGEGGLSGGPLNDSGGWADQLSGLTPYQTANRAVAGTTATCWGRYWVNDPAAGPAAYPGASRVVVAYGVNDKRDPNCGATLEQFQSALGEMVGKIRAAIPNAPLYLAAILPNPVDSLDSLAPWNSVIQTVAQEYGATYVDTTTVLNVATDFADGTHPNLQGHTKLAQFWAGILS